MLSDWILASLDSFPPRGHAVLAVAGFLRLCRDVLNLILIPFLGVACVAGTCRSGVLLAYCAFSLFLGSMISVAVSMYRVTLKREVKFS